MPTRVSSSAGFLVLSTLLCQASAAITWRNCSSNDTAIIGIPLNDTRVQCAEFSVPLDWSDTSAQKITIGLTRLAATKPGNRIGSLFVNPGGPGVPTSELIGAQALGFEFFPDSITEAFDLIGMDPRGFGLSTGIQCDPDLWNQRVTQFPSSQEDFDTVVSTQIQIWESCYNMSGPLLYNIDTRSVARDMEAVRIALNDGPLNFLGISYGTVIAQTYAQLFPESYRTIAMDGIVDHTSSATNLFFTAAQTLESVINQFALWCNTTDTTNCPLTGRDVLSIWNTTVTSALNHPIPAPGCIGTPASLLNGSCYANVTATEFLSVMRDALRLTEGNATAVSQTYAKSSLARSKYASATFAAVAIPCLDFRNALANYDDLRYRLELGSYIAPLSRGASHTWTEQMQCLGFGHRPTYPQQNMDVPWNYNPSPITFLNGSVEAQLPSNETTNTAVLLVQSKYDPSCNYLWAENVRAGIDNSTLLLRDGAGHTSYLLHGEASDAINAYLLNLTLPAPASVVAT
ncbi:putative hydrolase [Cyphellophora attinorum]|uniref:Putative hydrolase n=1 Tax=Cyphellophora attinorum TaxID=1664694 RepID=A0A0N0NKX0_9EURO|nr:putative hydrolase [Phialophora attinorum]KPI38329.1 putative hydrolase [Phialophora attinorum]